MELRDYVRIVRRHWRLILTTLLIVVAVTELMTFRATPNYQSQARIFVSTTDQSVSDALQGSNFATQRVSSYADLVNGRELASRVVNRLGLDESPNALSRHISATVVPETVILEISATNQDPRLAQRIGQATAEELQTFVSDLETPPGKPNAPIKATIVDPADLPDSPISPQPLRNLALAVLLGLVLGLGLAVMRALLDVSVKGPDDIAQITEVPVLGGILFDTSTPRRPLITDLRSTAPRVEAFRILRTNLQFVDVDHGTKVIVVTSSMPGEGKTSTASNAALALQTAGQKTLLVDGDLRRPRLAELFGLEATVGLTSILLGRIGVDEAIQKHAASGLDVLTSGTLPPNPAELLQSQSMQQLVEKVRTSYDAIVIDAPPLLPVTDAALLAVMADGALIVVRQGKTTRDQFRHSLERLTAVGARPLGVTMNMVSPRGRTGGGYGYGNPSGTDGYGYAPARHST